MSYAAAAALQVAIYERLAGWAGLSGVSVVDEIAVRWRQGDLPASRP